MTRVTCLCDSGPAPSARAHSLHGQGGSAQSLQSCGHGCVRRGNATLSTKEQVCIFLPRYGSNPVERISHNWINRLVPFAGVGTICWHVSHHVLWLPWVEKSSKTFTISEPLTYIGNDGHRPEQADFVMHARLYLHGLLSATIAGLFLERPSSLLFTEQAASVHKEGTAFNFLKCSGSPQRGCDSTESEALQFSCI